MLFGAGTVNNMIAPPEDSPAVGEMKVVANSSPVLRGSSDAILEAISTGAGNIVKLADASVIFEGELTGFPNRFFAVEQEVFLDFVANDFVGLALPPNIKIYEEGIFKNNATSLNFTGDTTVTATVTPADVDIDTVAIGSTEIVDEFSVANGNPIIDGQTAFTLSNIPPNPDKVEMDVNGAPQNYGSDFTIAGGTADVTWLDLSFVLCSTDEIHFRYFI